MGEDTIQYELEVTGQKPVTYTCFLKAVQRNETEINILEICIE